MEKAYDLKALGLKLKEKGLDVAEDAAKVVAVSVLEWLSDSAKLSGNKYDDLVVALIPLIQDAALKQIDKIDGVEG